MKPFKPTANLSSQLGQPKAALTSINDRQAKRDSSWTRTSKAYRAAHPICQGCNERASTEVHHITPLSIDNSRANMLGWDGLEALCHECHQARHTN